MFIYVIYPIYMYSFHSAQCTLLLHFAVIYDGDDFSLLLIVSLWAGLSAWCVCVCVCARFVEQRLHSEPGEVLQLMIVTLVTLL